MLVLKPMTIVAAYFPSSRPMIGADLDHCYGGMLPVVLAGDLNAKHVNWNTRLSTIRGKLLCDFSEGNPCLIFGPETQTPTRTTPL
jgi:hypothetical protein